MKKPRILVIGSIFMDLIFHGIPRLAEYGESLSGESYSYVPGGKGANQAAAAARMGADTPLAGCLGCDDNGELLLNNLKAFHINTNHILKAPESQTGLALMLVDSASGRYVSYNVMGGNNLITPGQVEDALNDCHYDMILIQLEMPLETVYRTCEMAAERRIPVFLDAGPAMSIPLSRLSGIFIISPNESETKALTGITVDSNENIRRAAEMLYQRVHPSYVLLKLGERGAFCYDGTDSDFVPAFNDITAVDSTAAGDTFGGAFAAAYCSGSSIHDSVLFANAAAAICVSRRGGQPAIPSYEEVTAFLKVRGIDI